MGFTQREKWGANTAASAGQALRAVRAAALLASAAMACTPTPPPPAVPAEKPMTASDARFENVQLNVGGPNACSPAAPPLPWLGVVIQAPTQVIYRDGARAGEPFASIPICGFYQLELERLAREGKPLMLIAVNTRDGSRYVGPMLDEDPGLMVPPDARPVDPKELAGMVNGAYFNPNLARYVKLPAIDAVWEVHVEYGGAVSNRVRIAVVKR